MNEKLMNSVVSALVGGVVGAIVVFFASGKSSFDSLEVANLKIKNSAVLLNAEGKEDVIIREGSVLANNVVLGKKFIGTQYQGHVIVANRMFTSPDDLVQTPMDKWRFFTEIGSWNDKGGEMIVRSANGGNAVGQETNNGLFFRAGFDESHSLQVFARNNLNGVTFPVPFVRPTTGPAPEAPPAPEGDTVGTVPSATPTAPEPTGAAPETAANPGEGEATR